MIWATARVFTSAVSLKNLAGRWSKPMPFVVFKSLSILKTIALRLWWNQYRLNLFPYMKIEYVGVFFVTKLTCWCGILFTSLLAIISFLHYVFPSSLKNVEFSVLSSLFPFSIKWSKISDMQKMGLLVLIVFTNSFNSGLMSA